MSLPRADITKEQLIKLLCDTGPGSILRSLLQEESPRNPARVADILLIQKKDLKIIPEAAPITEIEFVPFECSQGFKSALAALSDMPFSTSKENKEGKSIQRGEVGLLVAYVKDMIIMGINEDKIKTIEQVKKKINHIFAGFIKMLKDVAQKAAASEVDAKNTSPEGRFVTYKSFIYATPRMPKVEEQIISRIKFYYIKKIETPIIMKEFKAFCANMQRLKIDEKKSDATSTIKSLNSLYNYVANLAAFYMNGINKTVKDFSAKSFKNYQTKLRTSFADFSLLMTLINETAKTFKDCGSKKDPVRMDGLDDVINAIKETCILFCNEGNPKACLINFYQELIKIKENNKVFLPSLLRRDDTFSTLLNKLLSKVEIKLESRGSSISTVVDKKSISAKESKPQPERQKSLARLHSSFFEGRELSPHPSRLAIEVKPKLPTLTPF